MQLVQNFAHLLTCFDVLNELMRHGSANVRILLGNWGPRSGISAYRACAGSMTLLVSVGFAFAAFSFFREAGRDLSVQFRRTTKAPLR